MITLRRLTAFTLLGLASLGAFAQDPEIGDLLIASGSLNDPNYAETVLLIVHQGEDGTVAVALNRPTWVEPAVAFPDVDSLQGFPGAVFFGGPVSPSQPLIMFERGRRMPQNSRHVVGSIYVSADLALLDDMDLTAPDAPRIRLFAGHAAWVPGQLEREIDNGNWRTLPAAANQIFADDPASLWDALPNTGDGFTASLY